MKSAAGYQTEVFEVEKASGGVEKTTISALLVGPREVDETKVKLDNLGSHFV